MKILQLSARLPYPLTDGGAIGIYNIAKALAAEGHEVTFVSFPLDDPAMTAEAVRDMSRFCRVRLTALPLPSRLRTLVRTIFRGAYPVERRMMPEMFRLLKALVEGETFDLVHLDHSHVGKYGLWLKSEFGLPIILRQHNFETLIYERFAKYEKSALKRIVARVHATRLRRIETIILRGVDAVAAITEEDVELMKAVAPDAKYCVIPAGVDLAYFALTDQSLVEKNSILWVGGLDWDPNKDAFSYFAREILPTIFEADRTIKFRAIGSCTDQVDESSLRSCGLNEIELLGRVEDIRPFLARSAVMVVPLRIGGGMRVKLLEFFAAGKAVVSTHVGAEGNQARDGVEVILRDNPLEFAVAVVELLRDHVIAQKLGRSARSLVEADYSWQKVGSSFTSLYKKVLKEEWGLAALNERSIT